jgi:hypothetical protein
MTPGSATQAEGGDAPNVNRSISSAFVKPIAASGTPKRSTKSTQTRSSDPNALKENTTHSGGMPPKNGVGASQIPPEFSEVKLKVVSGLLVDNSPQPCLGLRLTWISYPALKGCIDCLNSFPSKDQGAWSTRLSFLKIQSASSSSSCVLGRTRPSLRSGTIWNLVTPLLCCSRTDLPAD